MDNVKLTDLMNPWSEAKPATTTIAIRMFTVLIKNYRLYTSKVSLGGGYYESNRFYLLPVIRLCQGATHAHGLTKESMDIYCVQELAMPGAI